MQHKVKVTVIDKKCFTDYQEEYLADKQSGPCPLYNVGDEFVLGYGSFLIHACLIAGSGKLSWSC